MPERIQRKRTKGWRMPDGAVYVGRGSKWGNPFALRSPSGLARVPAVHHPDQPWEYEGRSSADGMQHDYWHPDGRVIACHVRYMTATESVDCYRALLHGDARWPLDFKHDGRYYPHVKDVHELAGKDLACWCPPGQPCHADVLLKLANPELTCRCTPEHCYDEPDDRPQDWCTYCRTNVLSECPAHAVTVDGDRHGWPA